MTIPAHAFAFLPWSLLKTGEIARFENDWLLVTNAQGRTKALGLYLTGENIGTIEDFERTDPRVLALNRGFSWRAKLTEVPESELADPEPGALMFGPQGPFLCSFHGGMQGYVVGLDGVEQRHDQNRFVIAREWRVEIVADADITIGIPLFSADTNEPFVGAMIVG